MLTRGGAGTRVKLESMPRGDALERLRGIQRRTLIGWGYSIRETLSVWPKPCQS